METEQGFTVREMLLCRVVEGGMSTISQGYSEEKWPNRPKGAKRPGESPSRSDVEVIATESSLKHTCLDKRSIFTDDRFDLREFLQCVAGAIFLHARGWNEIPSGSCVGEVPGGEGARSVFTVESEDIS